MGTCVKEMVTMTDADQLQPGPELDALVAKVRVRLRVRRAVSLASSQEERVPFTVA